MPQGRPMGFVSPGQMDAGRREELRGHFAAHPDEILVGGYDETAQQIVDFRAGHDVDEIMVVSYIADAEVKIEMYRQLASRLL